MPKNSRQNRESKLKRVRETEGWTLVQVARAAEITSSTLSKAEMGSPVRKHIWGKILKGINSIGNKTRVYAMDDILD